MPVATDANLPEPDPFGLHPGLFQVIDDTMIVGDVGGCFPGDGDVGHLGDLRKSSGGLRLQDAGSQRWRVFSLRDRLELVRGGDRWLIGDGRVR